MADSQKKRKRDKDGSSRPSKKAAVQAPESSAPRKPAANIKVSLLENGSELAPVVASTPGLSVPSDISVKPFIKRRRNAPARPGRSGEIATHELLLHSDEHPTIDYTGREEEAGGTDSLLKHYVGVYDPVTGDLQVMEARKMTVRGVVRSQQADPEVYVAKTIKSTNREARTELGQAFGTKKSKKAIAAVTENAIAAPRTADSAPVKLDSTTKLMLSTIGETAATMSTREQRDAIANEAKPRPKHNHNASTVQEVYTPSSLIGDEVMKLLMVKDWQEKVKAKQEVRTKYEYVSTRIWQCRSDTQKLRVLRYINAMLDFFHACKPRRAGRALPGPEPLRLAMAGYSDAIVESIRRKFSDRGEMSKWHVDLFYTHICALALIVDDFELDFSSLKDALKLELKELGQYFLEVGARVNPATQKQREAGKLSKALAAQKRFAKLKLPLEFPRMKFARRT